MNIQEVLSLFDRTTASGTGYKARCPAHDDRNPSLSITEGQARIVFNCHAGCTEEAVMAALKITLADLAPGPQIVAIYEYTDEIGGVLSQVVRYVPKSFRQRRPIVGNGGWAYNLDGVRRVLYRLPEVIDAEEVIFVEGEKDVETLREHGFVATTSAGGSKNWKPELGVPLHGKSVVVIADADTSGREHADQVCASLVGKMERLGCIYALPDKAKDVTAWLEGRGTAAALAALVRNAPEWVPPSSSKAKPSIGNAAVEAGLLRQILEDNSKMPEVLVGLQPGDFSDSDISRAYSEALRLREQGSQVTAGMVAWVPGGKQDIPVAEAVKIIKRHSRLRQIVSASATAISDAGAKNAQPEKVVEAAVKGLLGVVSEQFAVRSRMWSEISLSSMADLGQHDDVKDVFRSGVKIMDDKIGGLRRGEVMLIVGKTGHGKTVLAQQFAATASNAGRRVLFFQAEMLGEQLALRQISQDAGVPFRLIRRGTMEPQDIAAMEKAAAKHYNIRVVDQGITMSRLAALTELYAGSEGVDLVIVDYDQLVVGAEGGMDEEFWQRQAAFILMMKNLAQNLSLGVIVLAQPRKTRKELEAGEQAPNLDDIFGHSAMKNTPHIIAWVMREYFRHNMDPEWERDATLYVIKNRNGLVGRLFINFDPESVMFTHADQDVARESRKGRKKAKKVASDDQAATPEASPEVTRIRCVPPDGGDS